MILAEPRVKECYLHLPRASTAEYWIEKFARTCYQSRPVADRSPDAFVRMLIRRGHLAMLEHIVFTAIIEADRGFTHELVRHRLASYAQESTRYCNYKKEKFGSQITVISPPGEMTDYQASLFNEAYAHSESTYLKLVKSGVVPEIARMVLPIGIKAEIVITANLREWLHILELRDDPDAHPIMRSLAAQLKDELLKLVPSLSEYWEQSS